MSLPTVSRIRVWMKGLSGQKGRHSMKRGNVGTVPKCSFCGKRHDEVSKLIAGPDVNICDECAALCNEIVMEDRARRSASLPGILFISSSPNADRLYEECIVPVADEQGTEAKKLAVTPLP